MRGDKTHDVGISLLLTLLSACLTLTLFFFPETVRLLFYRQLFYFPSSVTPFVEMFLFFLLSVSSQSLSLSVPFCAGTYNVQCCGSRLWKTNSVKEKYHLKKVGPNVAIKVWLGCLFGFVFFYFKMIILPSLVTY